MDIGVNLPSNGRILCIRNPEFVTKIIDNLFFIGDYFVLTNQFGEKIYAVVLMHSIN